MYVLWIEWLEMILVLIRQCAKNPFDLNKWIRINQNQNTFIILKDFVLIDCPLHNHTRQKETQNHMQQSLYKNDV